MLEAAIQNKDFGEGGYEAWILLGEVRSMDEREELGMLALREGVRVASENGGAGGVGMLVRVLTKQELCADSRVVLGHILYQRGV